MVGNHLTDKQEVIVGNKDRERIVFVAKEWLKLWKTKKMSLGRNSSYSKKKWVPLTSWFQISNL